MKFINKKFGYLAELHNVRKAKLLWDGNTLSGASIRKVINIGLVKRCEGFSSLTIRGFLMCVVTMPIYWWFKYTHKM